MLGWKLLPKVIILFTIFELKYQTLILYDLGQNYIIFQISN